MVTLPFLALAVFVIVAFFLGIGIGAALKDSPKDSEKTETFPAKAREYTVTVTIREDQLTHSSLFGEDRVFLNISDRKPSIIREVKIAPPVDLPILKLPDRNLKLPVEGLFESLSSQSFSS